MYEKYIKNYLNPIGLPLQGAPEAFKKNHIFYDFSKFSLERSVLNLLRKTLGRGYSFKLVAKGRWSGISKGGIVYLIFREKKKYYLKLSTCCKDILGMLIGYYLVNEKKPEGFNFVDLLHYGSFATKDHSLLFFSISTEAPGKNLIDEVKKGSTEALLNYSHFLGAKIGELENSSATKATKKHKISSMTKTSFASGLEFYTLSASLDKVSQKKTEDLYALLHERSAKLYLKFFHEDHYLIPKFVDSTLPNMRFKEQEGLVTLFDTTSIVSRSSRICPPMAFPEWIAGNFIEHLIQVSFYFNLQKKTLQSFYDTFLRAYLSHTNTPLMTKNGLKLFITLHSVNRLTHAIENILLGDETRPLDEILDHIRFYIDEKNPIYTSTTLR